MPLNFSPEISELLLKMILLLCKKCFPAEYRFLTADWDESECNRNENGEFAEKPGGKAGEKEKEDWHRTVYGVKEPQQRTVSTKRPKGIQLPKAELRALEKHAMLYMTPQQREEGCATLCMGGVFYTFEIDEDYNITCVLDVRSAAVNHARKGGKKQ